MGGYGSGRPGHKRKAEDCRSLDANCLQREGCLRAGHQGSWVWSRDAEEVAHIGCQTTERHLDLDYRFRYPGDEWESVTENVWLTYAPCHYGGQRTYFRCPGVVNGRVCGRRVGKLFAAGKYFLCCHCYRIGYHSQSLDRSDRYLRRANKLRMALGGEPGTAYPIAWKPKGMWQRTYQRKRHEIEHSEHQANLLFPSKYSRLFSKDELEMYF